SLAVVWQLTSGLEKPTGVAVASDGSSYVADHGANAVVHVSRQGQVVGTWGIRGSAPGQFSGPLGVAIDAGGSIYVADHDNYRVQKFAPDGHFVLAWGSRGTETGQFDGPDGIAVGP